MGLTNTALSQHQIQPHQYYWCNLFSVTVMRMLTIPTGLEAALSGAFLLLLNLWRPRRRGRFRRGDPLAIIGLLIELVVMAGGVTLVLYGVGGMETIH